MAKAKQVYNRVTGTNEENPNRAKLDAAKLAHKGRRGRQTTHSLGNLVIIRADGTREEVVKTRKAPVRSKATEARQAYLRSVKRAEQNDKYYASVRRNVAVYGEGTKV